MKQHDHHPHLLRIQWQQYQQCLSENAVLPYPTMNSRLLHHVLKWHYISRLFYQELLGY
jgi:hypothetical protein